MLLLSCWVQGGNLSGDDNCNLLPGPQVAHGPGKRLLFWVAKLDFLAYFWEHLLQYIVGGHQMRLCFICSDFLRWVRFAWALSRVTTEVALALWKSLTQETRQVSSSENNSAQPGLFFFFFKEMMGLLLLAWRGLLYLDIELLLFSFMLLERMEKQLLVYL